MKEQYLGDSKDAFKWDYLDFLASGIGADHLDIVPMRTSPDKTRQGETSPLLYPASVEVQAFCRHLQRNRNLNEIPKLLEHTGKRYNIRLHKPNEEFYNHPKLRSQYFMNLLFENGQKRILFFDPDIGFEPKKAVNEKHIKYDDVAEI